MQVDFVLNLYQAKQLFSYAGYEMHVLANKVRRCNAFSKVILETCRLSEKDIIRFCELARENRIDYVKTSTGYGIAGADELDIVLMRLFFKGRIKASGGISTLEDCLKFIKLGAHKIGMSKSVEVITKADNAVLKPYNLDVSGLAGMIEHTNLNPDASEEDILKTVSEAKQYNFGGVVVRPEYFGLIKKELHGTNIEPCVVVGFQRLIQKNSSLDKYNVHIKEKLKEINACFD